MDSNPDGSSSVYFWPVVIAAVSVVLCFFVSYCAGAITSAAQSSVKKKAESGSAKAKKAMKILDDDIKSVRRANVIRTLCISAGMISCYEFFYPMMKSVLTLFTADSKWISLLSAATVFFVSCFVFVCFFMLLPEKIGEKNADTAVIRSAGAFSVVCTLFRPFTALSGLISGAVSGFSRDNEKTDVNQLAEDEILLMVDEGEENGLIEGNTKDMIENVFDFDDTTVGEIMTHRKDVVAVRDDARITDVVDTAIKSGRSRIPVYHDNIDDISGIIHVKDLLKYVSTNAPEGKITDELIKDAVFVPESKRCSEMFEYMTEHKTQIAVVVDEFGGTGGIITMEDLIESIVGSIQDEYDDEDEEIRQINEHSFTVDGATPLDEITELTGISFEDDDNDTIAGFLLDRTGHIPKSGEHPSVVIDGTRFTVQQVENRRIAKVMIVRKHHTDNEQN